MSTQLDVDPSAFTDAVNNYTKYYGMSQQLKGFMDEAAASYKADKQVDYNTALNAVRQKYVKDGSLQELEGIIKSGVDMEQAVLETPGALKEDVVLNDALASLGDVKTVMDELKNIAADPKYGSQYLQQDSERLTSELNQAVEIDKSTGQVRLKDPEALRNLGVTQMMLGNRRIASLMDQKLKAEGKELTDENREATLMQSLQPFVSGTVSIEKKRQNLENNQWRRDLEWARLAEERRKNNATIQQNPGASELISGKVGALYEIYSPKSNILQTLTGANPQKVGAWEPYFRKDAKGNRVLSPDGQPYVGKSNELSGTEARIGSQTYSIDGTYVDARGNMFISGRAASKSTFKSENAEENNRTKTRLQSEAASQAGSIVVETDNQIILYGPQRAIKFNPAYFQETMPTTQDREAYNRNASMLEDFRRANQMNSSEPTNFNEIQTGQGQQSSSGSIWDSLRSTHYNK